jgi:hypothetical protein
MEVGPTDAGVMHPDQDIVGSAGRNRNLPQLHADAGGGFYESAHSKPMLREREI